MKQISTKLDLLYKTTKTGAIQTYLVEYLSGTIIVTQGQLNGKTQSYVTICGPKNIGKSNETTSSEQAKLEAYSKWNKKIKSGYSKDESAPQTVSLPMKVKTWNNKNIPSGQLYSTPKLNGINGTYKLENGTLNLYSRGGELFPPIPHLEKKVLKMMSMLHSSELNGELYIHDTHLQDIASAVEKTNSLSSRLEFAIFDICDSNDVYSVRRDRMKLLVEWVSEERFATPLVGMPVSSEEEIEAHYNECVNKRLEGTVIKHESAMYEHNFRSNLMWKYKKAQDAEFLIVGHNRDKSGHPVFICNTNTSPPLTFKVKQKGTNKERLAIQADSWHGCWLKIEFETYSKDMKPLKPVGLHLRDCDINGRPLL
ncbi:MAG: hypothetical protein L3I99_05540 [Sulfurimonas sp.]|nr:hypothetical protein [Sulfurimonas sp.]